MKPETASKVKYGVWGLVLGAASAMFIGFSWGGWLTAGSSREATETALLTTRAAICVAQFTKSEDQEAILKEFRAMSSWKRADFIGNGGWDKMPGEAEAGSYTVKRACADGIEVLMDK